MRCVTSCSLDIEANYKGKAKENNGKDEKQKGIRLPCLGRSRLLSDRVSEGFLYQAELVISESYALSIASYSNFYIYAGIITATFYEGSTVIPKSNLS